MLSGIGGWAGIGMAAGLEKDTDGLGAVGGYKELAQYTELGGTLTVFALPAEQVIPLSSQFLEIWQSKSGWHLDAS